MNEGTQQLIRELAEKFGTTAEHLWGVLIRQAPISGVIGLALDALLLWLVYFAWKNLGNIKFDKWDEDFGKGMLYSGLIVASALVLIGVAVYFPVQLSGIINPEYWALKQILK